MADYVEGVLVRWPYGKDGVGVVTELPQGGKQIRVWFDDGSEQIFASDSAPIERFFFQVKDPVITLDGTTGVVTECKPVGNKVFYTVSLPSNVTKTVTETSLRPAPLADPVQRLQAGKVANTRKFALRSTAARYVFANRYDEFTSLENSRIEAKPHQISVAHRVISTYPHRFLLADEVGLGKTVEAGMVLKELRARGG